MPITKNQSDLPRTSGVAPDDGHRITGPLLEAWHVKHEAERDAEYAQREHSGLLIRASDAGKCARALGYEMRRRKALRDGDTPDEPSDPPSAGDVFRMNLGTVIHDMLQRDLAAVFPGSEVEVVILPTDDDDPQVSCRIDAIVTIDKKRIAVEIKSVTGYSFKAASIRWNGRDPEGPRRSAILQGAIGAYMADCDELLIINVALEQISKTIADNQGRGGIGRIASEWTFSREEFVPLAEAEINRLEACATEVEANRLPPRAVTDTDIPKGARVVNPLNGTWNVVNTDGDILSTGNTWQCGYCWDRTRCTEDLSAELVTITT